MHTLLTEPCLVSPIALSLGTNAATRAIEQGHALEFIEDLFQNQKSQGLSMREAVFNIVATIAPKPVAICWVMLAMEAMARAAEWANGELNPYPDRE